MVICDDNDQLMGGEGKQVLANSSIEVEALALKDGVRITQEAKFRKECTKKVSEGDYGDRL